MTSMTHEPWTSVPPRDNRTGIVAYCPTMAGPSRAIQISGSFGSRQEEAQRLGRLLRPKTEGRSAHFYTVVSRDTVDADFAQNRQRFLAEQGYAYRIIDSDDVATEA